MTTQDLLWLEADALMVAPWLLGWELATGQGSRETRGRIVEVEAYRGSLDPASHAFRGLTRRTAPMFETGGAVYVYLSYGVHTCVNIVTGPAGQGQAVLIRALEPTAGQDLMASRRGTSNSVQLTSGPGKLTQALGIGLELSGQRLGEGIRLIAPSVPFDPTRVTTSPRVGITKAVGHHWRFFDGHSPFVSRRTR